MYHKTSNNPKTDYVFTTAIKISTLTISSSFSSSNVTRCGCNNTVEFRAMVVTFAQIGRRDLERTCGYGRSSIAKAWCTEM